MSSNTKVELFYADWCGHCQRFKPEWAKLKKQLDSNNIGWGEYESQKDASRMSKEGIEGFPTIKITKNGKKEDYNGERTASAIMNYLKGVKQGGGGDVEGDNFDQCGGSKKSKHHNPHKKHNSTLSNKDVDPFELKYYKYKAKYMKMRHELGQ